MLYDPDGILVTKRAIERAHRRCVCPLCHRGLQLDRRLDGDTLRVECSGQRCHYSIEVKRRAYLYRRFRPDEPRDGTHRDPFTPFGPPARS